MALMTVASVSSTFAASSLAAANTTDTISASDIGTRGVVVEILNGGSSITVSVSDPGRTPAGNTTTPPAQTVAGSARGRVFVGPGNVDPATGLATLTYSSVTSVTSQAFRY